MNTVNKYKVNSLIPRAVEIINKSFPENKLSKTYSSYISSFSAGFVITTPMATAKIFESSKNSKEDKSLITKWIMNLIDKNDKQLLSTYLASNTNEKTGRISSSVLIEILTAATALKIAIRKFNQV